MTNTHTSHSISRYTLEISGYLDDFKDAPHSKSDFDALLRTISMELDEGASWKTKSSDKVFAYDTFVEAHYILASENASASDYAAFIAGKILCLNQWWRRLAKEGHYHLLGALLIACTDKTVDPKTRTALSNAIVAWTKSSFDVTRQDGGDLARMLFGDAWMTLYEDELDQGFTATFRSLLTTQPQLAFSTAKTKKTPEQTLPTDLAFP